MKKTNIIWNTHKENKKIENTKSQRINRFYLSLFLSILVTFTQYTLIVIIFQKDDDKVKLNRYAVAVTQKNIYKNQKANENDIKFVYMDIGETKEHYILNSEFDSFRDKKILIDIKENTPLFKNNFSSTVNTHHLPEKIPFGKRLFVLDVEISPILSHIQIGDRIDIIAHLQIPQIGNATETILDGIEIIGIGDRLNKSNNQIPSHSLSFYLSPDEVKILSFMKQYSKFSISLRNPNDFKNKKSSAVTFNKFLEDPRIKKIIKEDTFQIIHGEYIQ
ncbi:hypothetical protein [Fluviispira vulneris]|uniref:hypothetical protein n=1 Tax=Fluviispira vulneris TaxID=2763012 RepID=UPI001646020C|nr:hypothetical protein [Fluviispira vulneris]